MLSQERALPPFPHQAQCGQTSCGQGQGPRGLRTRAGLGHSWPQTHQPWPVLASGARLSPSHPPGLGVYWSGGPLPSHCPESPWGHPAGTRVDLPLKLWCAQQRGLVHGRDAALSTGYRSGRQTHGQNIAESLSAPSGTPAASQLPCPPSLHPDVLTRLFLLSCPEHLCKLPSSFSDVRENGRGTHFTVTFGARLHLPKCSTAAQKTVTGPAMWGPGTATAFNSSGCTGLSEEGPQ